VSKCKATIIFEWMTIALRNHFHHFWMKIYCATIHAPPTHPISIFTSFTFLIKMESNFILEVGLATDVHRLPDKKRKLPSIKYCLEC